MDVVDNNNNNGRTIEDVQGKLSFCGGRGNCIKDYCMWSHCLLKYTENLIHIHTFKSDIHIFTPILFGITLWIKWFHVLKMKLFKLIL